ncbi:MAG: urease accessory protein UreH [Candidatus Binatia bacterium]|nr:urease accessory protein UreH [Candidatus Binatia bacterium]
MLSLVGVALAGLLLGVKHALDADHLVAVATIASESGAGWRAASVGAWWGLGHTAALAIAGVAVITLGITFPPWLTWWMELAVATALVGLGATTLYALGRGHTVHLHVHRHGDRWHAHPHVHYRDEGGTAEHSHHGAADLRALAFGLLHGFAGSAGLFLLVLATQPSSLAAWCYLAAFGAGSTAGMATFGLLLTAPLRWQRHRFALWQRRLRGLAAVASVLVGLLLGYELLL